MSISQISNNVVGETNEQKSSMYEEYQKKLNSYKTQWNQFDEVDKQLIGNENCNDIEKKLLELQEMINTEAEEEKIDELINSLYKLIFGGILDGYKSEWENFDASEKDLLGPKICDQMNSYIEQIKRLYNEGGKEAEIVKLVNDLRSLFFGNSEGSMSLEDRVNEIRELRSSEGILNKGDYIRLLECLQDTAAVFLRDFIEIFSESRARFINGRLNEESSRIRYNNLTENMSIAMKVILSGNRYKEFEMENIAYNKLEERAKIDPEVKKHLEEGIGALDNNSSERRAMILQEEANKEIKNKGKE